MPALLDIDATDFVTDGTTPQRVRHHLQDHPLLTLDALAELADRLPASQVEHNVAKDADVLRPGGEDATLSQRPGEIVRGIDSNGCWMVLKLVETDSAYRQLLHDALGEIAPMLPGGASAMLLRQGFIFLSAPNSVTPAHCDFENNFLLQIRGRKTMHLGAFPSEEAWQREMERSNGHGHRNMEYEPIWEAQHHLEVGDGLYVPIGKPHWVQNGDGVSISLSITWRDAFGLRAEHVHAVNDRLRKLGLSPSKPGDKPGVDAGKAFVRRASIKGRQVISKVTSSD